MREFVEFIAYGEYGKVGSPPGWPEIAVAALRPLGPKVIDPWPHSVKFEFDFYPEGLETVEAQLRRQGLSVHFNVRGEYTAAEVRQAELLVSDAGRVVTSVEDTLHWEDVTVCRSCGTRTAHWQYARCRSWSHRRAPSWPEWITGRWSAARSWPRPCARPGSRAWR